VIIATTLILFLLKTPIALAYNQLEYYINYYFLYHNITISPSSSKNVLLISNSKMGGGRHLMYMLHILKKFLEPLHIKDLLLITYAYPNIRDGVNTHMADDYLPEIKETFEHLKIRVHQLDATLPSTQQKEIISTASAIYFTGGNTFHLIKTLYDNDLISTIKEKIRLGTPVIGVSAGTVIHGPTMKTTNDMPVAFPRSFESLNTVPFQINAHYNNMSTPGFQGETRDDRIKEYLQYNRTLPGNLSRSNFVIGLKEGTAIHISGNKAELVGFGTRPAEKLELESSTDKLIKSPIMVGSMLDNLLQ
jgi:dipeptidase E